MNRVIRGATVVAVLCVARAAHAADVPAVRSAAVLSDSLQSLVAQVAPSVVQIAVTSYAPVDRGDATQTDLVVSRQRSIGSGVIVDASGYILTNEHVISGARRVQVVLSGLGSAQIPASSDGGHPLDAHVVGVSREFDLALLKVDAAGLRPLLLGDSGALHQGELVLAFGSPEGFRNSVSMGVVSAVARQPDPDTPLAYIQTDAAINHGNSGGPLVNMRGEMVGMNTFIVSKSGGSQGLGFALPSAFLSLAYPKLREFGELHRPEVGMVLQTVTPSLAAGLRLSRDRGLIVADVTDGKPASAAGLRIGDVVETLDGDRVDTVLQFATRILSCSGDQHVTIGGVRGDQPFAVDVAVVPHVERRTRLTDFIDGTGGTVTALGIVGVGITPDVAELMPSLRAASGVVVAGHSAAPGMDDVELQVGDVIHTVNGELVSGVDELRGRLRQMSPGQPVVLQIERDGQLSFVTFDAE